MTSDDRQDGLDPVDGRIVVEALIAFITRFVVLPGKAATLTLALWVLHTHAFEAAEATPYIDVVSPEKRSGKSRLLEVIELIARGAWRVAGVSEPVLFRKIEAFEPTLMLDEMDAIMGASSERTEPLRAILNAGNRRGGRVSRCVGPNHDVRDFGVFCPKALARIETTRYPETVRDRSIRIRMDRKADEPVERFRYRKAKLEAEGLREQAARFAVQHLEALTVAEPELPEELDDRAAEGWEALFAIADVLGPDYGERARRASLELSAEMDVEDESFGVQLLRDIRAVMARDEVIGSEKLCTKLKDLAESPWDNWGRERREPGITQRDLSRLLKPFGIKPRTVRLTSTGRPNTAKGYKREQFEDAWRRYLPSEVEEGVGR